MLEHSEIIFAWYVQYIHIDILDICFIEQVYLVQWSFWSNSKMIFYIYEWMDQIGIIPPDDLILISFDT